MKSKKVITWVAVIAIIAGVLAPLMSLLFGASEVQGLPQDQKQVTGK